MSYSDEVDFLNSEMKDWGVEISDGGYVEGNTDLEEIFPPSLLELIIVNPSERYIPHLGEEKVKINRKFVIPEHHIKKFVKYFMLLFPDQNPTRKLQIGKLQDYLNGRLLRKFWWYKKDGNLCVTVPLGKLEKYQGILLEFLKDLFPNKSPFQRNMMYFINREKNFNDEEETLICLFRCNEIYNQLWIQKELIKLEGLIIEDRNY
jgi:hypothetical protein